MKVDRGFLLVRPRSKARVLNAVREVETIKTSQQLHHQTIWVVFVPRRRSVLLAVSVGTI